MIRIPLIEPIALQELLAPTSPSLAHGTHAGDGANTA